MQHALVETPEIMDVPVLLAQKVNTGEYEKVIVSSGLCGQICPHNTSNHHGKCYLDLGHGFAHKCSVDGHEF